jgi:hypothetical protein
MPTPVAWRRFCTSLAVIVTLNLLFESWGLGLTQ